MSPALLITLAVAGGWLALACLLPMLRAVHRPRAFWALVATGVPVLGWLTLNWGPVAGVAGFAMGLAVLFWPPRRQPRNPGLPPLD
ncbi:DUF2484 family protein [Paracoccus spongiarum]|uniref:DUF2484 family protein n=1 Tax=Paracoccus spongiarum TaxID=3064387 RepID=A0ABT9J6X3_9RHOB|nr:DUF2484 family protein [Paracoccus sp. 2205BS29-5]MDP5305549.1 DUF2484 family protein [Paracoccus sp. 2205BS29-5]